MLTTYFYDNEAFNFNTAAPYYQSDKILTLDEIYPVGSVRVTAANNAPDSGGGTWELIDKKFKTQLIQESSNFTIASNGTNTNISRTSAAFNGDMIFVKIDFTFSSSTTVSDTTQLICTLLPAGLGMTTWCGGSHFNVMHSDEPGAIFMTGVNGDTGAVSSYDTILKTTSSSVTMTSSYSLHYSVTLSITDYTKKLDSFCDKFYWKRTA